MESSIISYVPICFFMGLLLHSESVIILMFQLFVWSHSILQMFINVEYGDDIVKWIIEEKLSWVSKRMGKDRDRERLENKESL